MPGLNLSGNVGVVAAATPSMAAGSGSDLTSITSRAFGVNTMGAGGYGGSGRAAYGAVGLGVAATALLVWIWTTLPR
jgi:hypothetical protein